ncbi:SusC/RagA family TonB-linked outer membrane protein [Bacteroides sp. 224]|uniref:SusC/RagA family TonB-linked outer membrane protein n=1 Tax=Bacteroides sp. 224 TaxID=2302936 RepID=UPI0013D150A9|nr:SusC/RagA family TonB-linked outer membrane protein [Bacteroides sp. 224]
MKKAKNFYALRHRKDWLKNLSMMRVFFILLVLIAFAIPAKGFSQRNISLDLENSNLVEIIKAVRNSSGYRFLYSDNEVSRYNNRDFKVNNAGMKEVMEELLKETSLTYEVENEVIIIKPKNEETRQAPGNIIIRGKVVDQYGATLPGASIRIKETQTGTITNDEGSFAFSVPKTKEDIILVISFVGLKTKEVKYTGQKDLRVMLVEDEEQMEEVIVTGIFTRKKEGFTGSTTKITHEEIKQYASGNVLKALEIVDPSFKIETSNLAGSNPNAVANFSLRGQASLGDYMENDAVMLRGDYNSRPNQPLFVLDGVIGVSSTAITDIDPDQVESITILKDAAATVIYGSEAANGVVVVETRRPVSGKLRFSYSGVYGLSTPDLSQYNLADAREKLEIEELAGYYNTNDIEILRYYTTLKRQVEKGVDTDWLAKPVQNAFTHRHGLNIEGGEQSLRYKVYLGASFAPGVMRNTDLNTKSGRVDVQYRSGKFMFMNQTYLDYSKGRRESNYGQFSLYTQMNPYYTPYDEYGNIKKNLSPNLAIGGYDPKQLNPLWNTLFDSRNETQGFTVKEALKVEYNPIENMRLAADFTISRFDESVDIFKSTEHTEMEYFTDPSRKGSFTKSEREGWDYRLMLTGSYNKLFNKDHLMSLYAQYMMNESYNTNYSLNMSGYPNDKLSEFYMGTTYNSLGGNESRTRKLGFAFTANYSYKERYAFDYSMRLDASSQFGKDKRFAPFWSVGARWNANKEKFIKDLNVFDELVLRTSYGITGVQGFDSYQALQMYTYTNTMKEYLSSDVIGAELYSMGNPDLKWQQTKNYNAALDFTILKGLVSLKLEYYYKYTDNMLLGLNMAPSTGFTSIQDNLGCISNKGFEFGFRLTPYKDASKQAYWNILVNGVRNRSKIEKISDALKQQNEDQKNKMGEYNRPLPVYESGYSPSAIWAVQSAGIDAVTGKEIFITREGELTTQWSTNDLVRVGDTEPDWSGTLASTFAYKGLTLTVAGRYTFGGQKYNRTLVDKVENADLRLNVDKRVLYDRWQKPGDVASFKGLSGSDPSSEYLTTLRDITKSTSRFVMKNNEFAISTINLSYRMDNKKHPFLNRLGVSAATVGCYFEDILRLSTIKMERGIEYPFSRSYSMSLNLIF